MNIIIFDFESNLRESLMLTFENKTKAATAATKVFTRRMCWERNWFGMK